jgi:type III secretory pathway component EscS
MDPLSPWTYGRRNLRRILPLFIILAFVVMLVVAILTALGGLKESALAYTREFDHWTVLFPRRDTRIPASARAALEAHPAVERLIDSRNCFVRVRTLIGPVPYHLRAVRREEAEFLLARAGNRLKEGSLPRPGTSEVALHENLMKANGWTLGAEFGMEVTEEDWMPGRFRVVGILEGPTPLGLASFEYLDNPLLYPFSAKLWERLIVAARPGRLAELNAFLRTLPDVKPWDKERAVEEVSEAFDRIVLIFNFISALLIVVVAGVVGLLHNIFFAQRLDEFAILLAIGHTRRRLLGKALLETAGLMAVSWAAGLGLALAALETFRQAVLLPRGISPPAAQPGPVLVSLALPLVAQAFAGATVFGRLRTLDPVTIIERRGS